MDPVLLARIQFAVTIGFHFLFPPISIGLAWLLVVIEGLGWRRRDEVFVRLGKFFARLLALTFAVGVATGIVMEFQFGTNWAAYSRFVGDVFGAPLAAEVVLAFFLESGFLGLYLFGRDRVSKGVHWFSILLVAVGATLSAFWILVANSWQQTPAGFVLRNGRAELQSFSAAVLNPSTLVRFEHVMVAALLTGCFFMAAIASLLLLRRRGIDVAARALAISLPAGLVLSLLAAFPTGHRHGRQVAMTQPEKFAAMEGIYRSVEGAPLLLFALPVRSPAGAPLELRARVELPVPGLLSLLTFGDARARIPGIESFPADQVPPLWLTFVSFHSMVLLGLLFQGVTALGVLLLLLRKLLAARWYLTLLVAVAPLTLAASQFGWAAAEVGRQPWLVYKLLRTSQGISGVVSPGEILFSLGLLSIIYLALLALYVYLVLHKVGQGPEPPVPATPAAPTDVLAPRGLR